MSDDTTPVELRLKRLLEHMGIDRAHFAGSGAQDYRGLVQTSPETLASLTLVSPGNLDPAILQALDSRLLLIHGDQGPNSQVVPRAQAQLKRAATLTLPGYVDASWSDVIADRGEAMFDALVAHIEAQPPLPVAQPQSSSGTTEGIRYQVRGSGPPLLLLPLALTPSQWEPLIERLSDRFCTILLGGAELGMVAQLEERARTVWYQGMLRDLISAARLEPGQRVLEVGCGGGTVVRWLARHTAGANPIVGVDINRYLLNEARALAEEQGLADFIDLREGNAEDLPCSDGEFDVTLCVTVLEEGDADQMLRELSRVTRSGGSVATMVRSVDLPWWVNVPVRPEIKVKAATIGSGGVAVRGCADASLARRMSAAGLVDVDICPRLATIEPGPRLETALSRVRAVLSPAEVEEWQSAVRQAQAEKTLFIAQPYYCAVGRKPL
ncbi:MAG: class I SAM-dependent methyltransferase [Chloroflexota bacterium]